MKQIAALLLVLIPVAAFAQEPKPLEGATLNRAISAVQIQRNQALDQAAINAARSDDLQEQLAAAQARIKELEAKPKK